MIERLSVLFATVLLLLLLSAPTAYADSINFFNTGVAADGSTRAVGAVHPHYDLIYNSTRTPVRRQQ